MRKIRFAQEQIIETLNEPQGGALPDVLAKHAFFFDLGETLYTYADVPLSWSEHYRPALVGAALECGVRITNEKLDAAIVELSKFDTRKYPRLVEHPADFIFRQVIFALGLTVDYLAHLIHGIEYFGWIFLLLWFGRAGSHR
ncbi:hypothetical protein ACLRDC_17215, partial [Gluconacetobacter sacchari]|uniref:hypothetical protein n=1 Tax=Gluconacetobacter sacchari TaxID=92759 RepID=UPI0039B36C32